MKGDAILKHPDKDEIISMLCKGQSTYYIERFLKKKYPHDKSKHLTWITLQAFRKNYLSLEGEVLQKLKEEKKKKETEEKNEERKRILAQAGLSQIEVPTQQVKNDDVQKVIDMNTTVSFIYEKIMAQIKLLENEEFNYKNSKVISDYINQLRGLMVDYAKVLQKFDENQSQSSLSEGEIAGYIGVLKEAIRETLSEVAPDAIPVFMNKFKSKLDIYKKLNEHKRLAWTNFNVKV